MRGEKKHVKQTAKRRRYRGGYGPGAGPVGYPWSSKPENWPGVLAANGADTEGATMSNFYPLSKYGIAVGGVDPAVPEVQFGGKRKVRKAKKSSKKSINAKAKANAKASSKTAKKQHRKRGGKKSQHNRAKRHMRGGFLPQELLNFGRNVKYGIHGVINDFMGYKPPVNPSPLDQPINGNYKVIEPVPINLGKSYRLAGATVAEI